MKIESLDKYVTPKTTGYAATAGLVLSVVSGVTKRKALRKIHKPIAYASCVMTGVHIGLIEYNNYVWKNKKNKIN